MWRILLLGLLLAPQEKAKSRIVAAYYEAKWDAETGENMHHDNGTDALQDHPNGFKDFSYRSVEWHARNLEDMGKARIDVAVCMFSSEAAVAALVKALEKLDAEHTTMPRVSPLSADPAACTSFLDRVPAKFHYTVEKAPMVWITNAPKASGEALSKFRGEFASSHGGQLPFVVASPNWPEADVTMSGGGAFAGPSDGDVAILGPGLKESALKVRDRDKGAWYERSWYIAMKMHPRIVVIQSWNDFTNGTEICESVEYKRDYIDLTRRYAEAYSVGSEIARPKGKYTDGKGVSWNLKFDPPDAGLKPVDVAGGGFEIVEAAGLRMLTSRQTPGVDRRVLAFAVDDSFAFWERRTFEVHVDILDRGKGKIVLEYDSSAPKLKGAEKYYRAAEAHEFTDSGEWRKLTFKLPEGAFANRQAGETDFRLVTEKRGMTLRWVIVQ